MVSVLEAGSPRLRCQQGLHASESAEEGAGLGLSPVSGSSLACANSTRCPYMASPCAYVCVPKFSHFIKTPVKLDEWLTLFHYDFILNHLQYILRYGGRGVLRLQHMNFGDT